MAQKSLSYCYSRDRIVDPASANTDTAACRRKAMDIHQSTRRPQEQISGEATATIALLQIVSSAGGRLALMTCVDLQREETRSNGDENPCYKLMRGIWFIQV